MWFKVRAIDMYLIVIILLSTVEFIPTCSIYPSHYTVFCVSSECPATQDIDEFICVYSKPVGSTELVSQACC